MAIATTKAALVTIWFIHARGSSPLIRLTIASGVMWLVILMGLTMTDFATRTW